MERNLYPIDPLVSREMRESIKNQRAKTIWMYGLSGSGKTTIANRLDLILFENGFHSYVLDGDSVRSGLNKDLGFTENDRDENIRRCAEVCRLINDSGIIVIACFITPLEKNRKSVREILGNNLIEVFVDADLSTCIDRDPKGLYRKAMDGKIANFTGISAPFEASSSGVILKNNDPLDIDRNVNELFNLLK